jgi:hypothetical protein
MSDYSFTKEGVERPADNDFSPLPAGDYPAMVEKTEWANVFGETDQDPKHLKLTITIIDGEYKNRKVWRKLKLRDLDPAEKKKATGVLAQLLDAINLNGINNTAELCNIPHIVKLTIWTPPNGKPMNVVNSFAPMVAVNPATIGQPVGEPAKVKHWEM